MKSKSLAAALTLAAAVSTLFATPFIGVADVEAKQSGKSLKCFSRPVAGKVGVYAWTCSNIRI